MSRGETPPAIGSRSLHSIDDVFPTTSRTPPTRQHKSIVAIVSRTPSTARERPVDNQPSFIDTFRRGGFVRRDDKSLSTFPSPITHPSSSIPSPEKTSVASSPFPTPTPSWKRLPRRLHRRSRQPCSTVKNTELTDCRLLGDEKKASAGNPKERESRNGHGMAGDSGVSLRTVNAGPRGHDAGASGGKKHVAPPMQTEATRLVGARPGTSHPQFDPSSHNDAVICTNNVPINTHASSKSRFNPFLSRKRFSPGKGFRLPRSRGTDPLPCVIGRRNVTQGSVSHARFGKTPFTLLAVLSIGFRRIIGHGVL